MVGVLGEGCRGRRKRERLQRRFMDVMREDMKVVGGTEKDVKDPL